MPEIYCTHKIVAGVSLYEEDLIRIPKSMHSSCGHPATKFIRVVYITGTVRVFPRCNEHEGQLPGPRFVKISYSENLTYEDAVISEVHDS